MHGDIGKIGLEFSGALYEIGHVMIQLEVGGGWLRFGGLSTQSGVA